MRKTPAKPTRPDDPVAFSPLTDLQKLAGGAVTCTIGGRELKLQPLDLNDLVAFEAEVGPLSCLEDKTIQATAVRFVLWRSILHGNPEATLEDAGRLFGMDDLDAMGEVLALLFQPAAEVGDGTP
jgi:hypothetical protein